MLNRILPKLLRTVDNSWFPIVKSRRYLRYTCIPYCQRPPDASVLPLVYGHATDPSHKATVHQKKTEWLCFHDCHTYCTVTT